MKRLLPILWMSLAIAGCQREGSPAANPGALAQADATTPAEADRLSALRADALPTGFELADRPRHFDFPRDHGPHPTFRHEWWYVTGHLDAENGEPFGFELTFFRFALKPGAAPPLSSSLSASASASASASPPASSAPTAGAASPAPTPAGASSVPTAAAASSVPTAGAASSAAGVVPAPTAPTAPNASNAPNASPASSAWRTTQIYMAHFAVSDIARRDFKVSERFARDALGLAGAQAEPFRVSLDDWSLAAAGGDAASASGTDKDFPSGWRLKAADRTYSLDLNLTPASPIMLNGDAGLSQKSDAPGAASYYYSIPRMTAEGKLIRNGKSLNVKGTVWLDREWGSGSLGGDQQGWDWYAVQLDDGSALMFYALRKRDDTRDAHSAGTWLAPDGTMRPLSSNDVQIDVKNEWESPRGGRYPARWQMRVPSLQLDLDIEPRLADQELTTSTRYWEGASTVRGTREGKPITGKAYVELVGYATAGAPPAGGR